MSLVSITKCLESDGVTPKSDCFIVTNSNGESAYVDKTVVESILGYPLSAGKLGGQTIIGGLSSLDDLNLYATSHTTPGNTSWIRLWPNPTTEGMRICKDGTISMGATALRPSKLTIETTLQQLRIGYNVSQYYTTTVDSVGNVTFDAVGDNPRFKFADRVNIPTHAPSSATDTGEVGDIAWDANYFYVCVATNQWTRTPLSTW